MAKSRRNRTANGGGRNGFDRREVTVFLELLAQAYTDYRSPQDVARIVQCYTTIINKPFPRWRDLNEQEKFILIALTGARKGVNHSLTFNISDQQRIDWEDEFGNITDGFKREVLHPACRVFRGEVNYWLAVEPHVSRGIRAKHYVDTPASPRRFDVHMAIAIDVDEDGVPNTPELKRFQRAIWKRAEHLAGDRSDYAYPLFLVGGMARMKHVYDTVGWQRYCFKFMRHTVQLHADVVGPKPWGASNDLRSSAGKLYSQVRGIARDGQPDPAYVARVASSISGGMDPLMACCVIFPEFYADSASVGPHLVK